MKIPICLSTVLVCLVAASSAGASTLYVTTLFNGTTPGSSPPWLTADFRTLSPGTVQLTLTSSLSVASEFIDEVGINLNPAFSPAALGITQVPGQIPAAISIAHTTPNGQDLTGGGSAGTGFDIEFQWLTSNKNGGVNRFDGSDVNTFLITAPGLIASDLDTWTSTGSAGAIIAAHVQGIPVTGGGTISGAVMNGTVSTPEPASWRLAGGAALILLATQRRRLRSRS